MFGGYGIYRGEVMFAIIVDDQLYFEADSVASKKFSLPRHSRRYLRCLPSYDLKPEGGA